MAPDYVIIDFETRAARNLKKTGVEKYVQCPHFDALCLGYQWPVGEPELWRWRLPVWPDALFRHVRAGGIVVAHNAGFELAVWNELHRREPHIWPELKPEQCIDTMVQARNMGLPGGLDDALASIRLPVSKDKEGYLLMLKMCQPRQPLKGEPKDVVLWHETEEQLERLGQYCLVDVVGQHALFNKLPRLTPKMQDLWALGERINQTGIAIDVPAAKLAEELVDAEHDTLNSQFRQYTRGVVQTGGQRDVILKWLNEQGVVIGSLKKMEVQKLLDDPEALRDKDTAKMVLQLRKASAKGSTAKLSAMLTSACADGSARGLFNFFTAATSRFGGRRIQTQNMPRTPKWFKPKDAAQVIEWLKHPKGRALIQLYYGSVMDAVSWSLRSFLIPRPGRRFIACDFSNIEGRVLAWLAGEDWKLDAFRAFDTFARDANGHKIPDGKGDYMRLGPDLYKVGAARILRKPLETIDDDERQVMGKVPELAMGYQGGIGAYISMGANYGVTVVLDKADAPAGAQYVLTEAEVDEIKVKWREANPAITQFWYDLLEAAMNAVRYPGEVFSAGRIHYRVNGDFLLCLLPSGECISFPYPAIQVMTTSFYEREIQRLEKALEDAADDAHTDEGAREYGHIKDILDELRANPDKREQLTYWGVSSFSKNKKWGLQRIYGGALAAMKTQATATGAKGILGDTMLRVAAHGYDIVAHSHDELVCDVPIGFGSVNELAQIMCATSPWTHGLPVAAAGWEGDRYRK